MSEQLPSMTPGNRFDKWFDPLPILDNKSLMDHLFHRLDGLYPHKWRSNFTSQAAIDNWQVAWVEAFEEGGITPKLVKFGLQACRVKFEWPPSCAEFIKACRPGVDPLVAYYEAVAGAQARSKGEAGAWTHPAIYWAAMPLAFDLLSQTYSTVKHRWEHSLSEQIGKGKWEPIPEPSLQLPAPEKKASTEVVKMAVDGLKIKSATKEEATIDYKLWAKRIIKREKQGDKTLSLIQKKFAHEAMNSIDVYN